MRLTTCLCAALLLLGFSGCGANSDQRAAGDTVTRFYQALQQNDARAACRLLDPATAAAVGNDGKSCVAAFRQLFRRVAGRPEAQFFDSVKVGAATVDGDSATVVVRHGVLRRHVSLRRAGDRWRITGSPDFQ